MPAKPSYAHRLKPALAALEKRTETWLGRRHVEELLSVSKTVAWRILRQCQAQRAPDGSYWLDRQELIRRLTELAAEGGTIAREVARQQRVEDQLLAMRSFLRSRAIEVVPVDQAPALRKTRFENLPANITFTPRSLLLEFRDTPEFLAAVGAIVYALENDYNAIRDFIEERKEEA